MEAAGNKINPEAISLYRAAQTAASDGDFDKATALLLQAADAEKESPEFLVKIAKSLEEIKKFGKAHDVYLMALEKEPDHTEGNNRLGHLYLGTNRPVLAAERLEKVVQNQPRNAQLHFNLAIAYAGANDFEKAAKVGEKARDLGFENVDVFNFLANAYDFLNREESLVKVVKEGLKKFPEDTWLKIYRARGLADRDKNDEAFEILKNIDPGKIPKVAKAQFFFDIGKHYDRLGDSEKAFECFQKGNDLKKEEIRTKNLNPEAPIKVIQDSLNLNLKAFDPGPHPEKNLDPIFLIGFPRSGTTLLDQILDSHSVLFSIEEKPLLLGLTYIVEEMEGGYPAALQNLEAEKLEELRQKYFKIIDKNFPEGRNQKPIDKLPLNIIYTPFIYKLFPNAKFILALRHPCDSCLSCFMQNFELNSEMANFLDLDKTTRFYGETMKLWEFFSSRLPLNFYPIKYENLIENPEQEARALIEFLGVKWEPEVMNYQKRAREKGFINTPSYKQVIKPIYKKARFRWKKYEKYFKPYFPRLEKACELFGYDLE